jgi:hypothetical protein
MKKLKLELEKLAVETFTADERGAFEGTVDGYDGRTVTIACGTCDLSCQVTACYDWTCENTCAC